MNLSSPVTWLASCASVLLICCGCKAPDLLGYKKAPTPLAGHGEVQSQLDRGRTMYVSVTKCNLCHRPKPVGDYSPEQWTNDILPSMGKKARLTDEQYADLLAYVTSPSAQSSKTE